jgi:F-type H+-transporting ATPase subunit b
MDVLNLSWQALLTQAIAFIILIWVLGKYLFRPIQDLLAARQQEVRSTLEQVEADRRAMETSRREYEARLVGIEAEAREKIQAAIKEAQGMKDEIIVSAHGDAERLLRRSQEEIQREKQRALVELRTEVADLAVQAAGKILGSSIDDRKHRDLISDFVNKVGAS